QQGWSRLEAKHDMGGRSRLGILGSSRLVCENGAKRDLLGMKLVTFGGASGSRLGVLRVTFGSAKRDLRLALGIMVVTFGV
ncbi:hypothetical protein PIB30_098965, partial [Stylosanthes scabra]|nr:hypothetical protein [Stylosanthes scabra]